ncbi:hypothetical protein C1H46_029735 [Malus baccata]|uniref:CCHC-type domain-containing protein n=1 Tax=Malus baccata TaxID=106549 RepID=A0A540LEK8_MALBA|nr:hypothetical protein C1H46_029735 [Malus baccata]
MELRKSVTDPTEVVATLKGFEKRLLRHAEARDVSERDFSCLGIQSRKSSQASGSKSKKYWKNKEKMGFVKSNAVIKYNGSRENSKEICRTCDSLHYGECWFKEKPKCPKCEKFGHNARDCRSKDSATSSLCQGSWRRNCNAFLPAIPHQLLRMNMCGTLIVVTVTI